MMRAERGTHFDARLLDIFMPMTPRLLELASDETEVAKTVFQLADTYLDVQA